MTPKPLAYFGDLPDAPETLLDMLTVRQVAMPAEAGRHTAEELEAMLSKLDVLDYADEAKWRDLMMSCHFTTAGLGEGEFVAWSTGDPDYANDEVRIRDRWKSLRVGKAGSITERTLYKALHSAGHGDTIPRESAAEDFAGWKARSLSPVRAAPCPQPQSVTLPAVWEAPESDRKAARIIAHLTRRTAETRLLVANTRRGSALGIHRCRPIAVTGSRPGSRSATSG